MDQSLIGICSVRELLVLPRGLQLLPLPPQAPTHRGIRQMKVFFSPV